MVQAGVTPVFHPWKLHLAPFDAYPGQIESPEPPYQIFDPGETEAMMKNMQYKALYLGPLDDWNSNPHWQHWTDFRNAPEKILNYQKHPEKPPAPEIFSPRT
ncbi:hypothetical protein BDW68DRAFT_192115 [Aspergillus falconensis]